MKDIDSAGDLGNMGSLEKLGVSVRGVLSNINRSSDAHTVSEVSQNISQGSLVKWLNKDGKEIVWMMTDRLNIGVVVHSDNLVSVGTSTDLKDYKVSPFIGTVNIHSAAKE